MIGLTDYRDYEAHALTCPCWECWGREPDNSSSFVADLSKYGTCAECGGLMKPTDSGPVHEECASDFMRFIIDSGPVHEDFMRFIIES